MNYVYIIQCNDGSYYTGWTNDLVKRINNHNEGKGAKYTRGRTPIKLVYYEVLGSKSEAMKREIQIKGYSRGKKELIVKEANFKKYYIKEECDMVRAVIFDMDGIIMNSRSFDHLVLHEFIDKETHRITELSPTDGIIHILEDLKNANVSIALVSSFPRKNLESILELLRIRDYFKVIISDEDFLGSKQIRDLYVQAGENLCICPEHCVVITGSDDRVKAARSANMKCIAYKNIDDKLISLYKEETYLFYKNLKEITFSFIMNLLNQ